MPFTPRRPNHEMGGNFNDFLEYYKYLALFFFNLAFLATFVFFLLISANNGRYRSYPDNLVLDTCTGTCYLPPHLSPTGKLMRVQDYLKIPPKF